MNSKAGRLFAKATLSLFLAMALPAFASAQTSVNSTQTNTINSADLATKQDVQRMQGQITAQGRKLRRLGEKNRTITRKEKTHQREIEALQTERTTDLNYLNQIDKATRDLGRKNRVVNTKVDRLRNIIRNDIRNVIVMLVIIPILGLGIFGVAFFFFRKLWNRQSHLEISVNANQPTAASQGNAVWYQDEEEGSKGVVNLQKFCRDLQMKDPDATSHPFPLSVALKADPAKGWPEARIIDGYTVRFNEEKNPDGTFKSLVGKYPKIMFADPFTGKEQLLQCRALVKHALTFAENHSESPNLLVLLNR